VTGIAYTATTSPPDVGARIRLEFSDDNARVGVRAVLEQVSPFSVLLRVDDEGGIGDEIVSGIALPLAQALAAVLPQAGVGLVAGRSFSLLTLPAVTQDVAGEKVTASLDDPRMGQHGGMLMIRSGLRVS
jgi:hypothetical protein